MRYSLSTIAVSFTLCGLVYANSLKGQKLNEETVNISVANGSLAAYLKQIENATPFRFAYKTEVIVGFNSVQLPKGTHSVAEVLELLLKQTHLLFTQADNYLVLYQQGELPNSVTKPKEENLPPSTSIKGDVKDEKDLPLPGVSVKIKGTSTGVITNPDGQFTINVPTAQQSITLVFSFVGYQSQEIAFSGGKTLHIRMVPATTNLNDVIVVGYGVQKKATLTGAVNTISGTEIAQSPISNISNALIGRLPGITSISQGGQPGKTAADIFVRGRSTFNDASPIILVDGVERTDFGNIDPNEIESVSELKDASSTAIFGIRGANGVIIITTKRGKVGKPTISYSGNVSAERFTRLPNILDSYNTALLQNEGNINDQIAPRFTDAELQKFKDGSDPIGYPNVDLYKYFIRPYQLQTQHNLNVLGGTEYVKYFASAGYLFENGVFKDFPSPYNIRSNNYFGRYNFRTNLDFQVTKDLKIGIGIGGIFGEIYQPAASTANFQTLGQYFYRIFINKTYAYPILLPDGRLGYNPGDGQQNMLGLLTRSGYQIVRNTQMQTTFTVNYKLNSLTPGLAYTALVSYDNNSSSEQHQYASFAAYNINRQTDQASLDPTYNADDPLNTLGGSNKGDLNYNIQTGFNYNRNFKNNNNLGGLILVTRKLVSNNGTVTSGNNPYAPYAVQGLAGRITYNYYQKYFIEGNGAYNGSENFAPGKRYGFFPAGSAGWTLSNEKFLAKNRYISYLKIRGSYGLVGNDKLSINNVPQRFLYLKNYTNSGTVSFGDPNAPTSYPLVVQNGFDNPNITWEKGLKRNIGLESSFFNGALSLNADFFDEKRYDILIARGSGPVTYGQTYPLVNFGKTRNKGYEIELRFQKQIGNIDLGLNSNVTYSKSKVISKDEPVNTPANLKAEGYPINQFKGYHAIGFFNSQAEIDAWAKSSLGRLIPGDLRFEDYNKDGTITADDRIAIGYTDIPEYIYSFEPRLAWKGISISALFQGVAHINTSQLVRYNWFDFMLNRWTPTNMTNATWPASRSAFNSPSYNTNDYLLQNVAYLKLRNAVISWQLPAKWVKSLKMSALSLTLSGQNLLTWTPFKLGYDPEITISNPEYDIQAIYPTSKTFNLRINAQF